MDVAPPPSGRSRWRGGLVVLALAGIVGLVAEPATRRPRQIASLALEAPPAVLPVPVAGVAPADLADTWGAPRSGGRTHQGIDIFAPRGTPVVSATRGLVLTVGTNTLGGHTVRVLGPGREIHYYAHLDAYGRFAAGDAVAAGDTLGFVGTTGNAAGTPPHLHYGLYTARWQAQNPYPRMTGG